MRRGEAADGADLNQPEPRNEAWRGDRKPRKLFHFTRAFYNVVQARVGGSVLQVDASLLRQPCVLAAVGDVPGDHDGALRAAK